MIKKTALVLALMAGTTGIAFASDMEIDGLADIGFRPRKVRYEDYPEATNAMPYVTSIFTSARPIYYFGSPPPSSLGTKLQANQPMMVLCLVLKR
jgi:hypothetical protein